AIVDARDEDTYAKSPVRIPSAMHVPPAKIQDGLQHLGIPKNRTVIAYCS
ncbi:MAG: rhodanese-like domain-containing protein, partial [Candidatus Rokubacteria bacterium]|nr:rhodanese-like domain-containing protein [Candidatus Rokubacteria bacterium]